MRRARPDRTYAVVVGVERYGIGGGWDLPGPAADARRFAGWLRGRGVPAANISLLLGPLPDARGPAVDVPVLPAERESVQEVLFRRLPACEGDLLWVMWGGHGVVDAQRHRRLFYADAGTDDKRNLDLDAVLTAFQTDLVPGFAQQIWLVDSCQTFAEDLGFARTLPADVPPLGAAVADREQFVLLASGPGQRAANDPLLETGEFSAATLDALRESEGREGGADAWPPDMPAVADRVIARFTSPDGRSGGAPRQRPSSLWYRSWTNDTRQLEFPRPRTAPVSAGRPLPAAALAELVERLLACASMTDPDSRQVVLSLLPPDLSSAVPRHRATRSDVISIVRTAWGHAGGLADLVAAVAFAEPGSLATQALEETAERLLAEATA